MIVYGYVNDSMVSSSGNLMLQVRIPDIHGPVNQEEYRGQQVKNYTSDGELPWYPSLALPYTPNVNDVVALMSSDNTGRDFIVLGLTGGTYQPYDLVQ